MRRNFNCYLALNRHTNTEKFPSKDAESDPASRVVLPCSVDRGQPDSLLGCLTRFLYTITYIFVRLVADMTESMFKVLQTR